MCEKIIPRISQAVGVGAKVIGIGRVLTRKCYLKMLSENITSLSFLYEKRRLSSNDSQHYVHILSKKKADDMQFFRRTRPPQQVDSRRRQRSTTPVDGHNSHPQATPLGRPFSWSNPLLLECSGSCVSAIALRWQTFEC